MDIRGDIEHILSIAVQAPSPDNAQPWRFRLFDHSLCIFGVPGRASAYYNYGDRCSYLAHGALIENINIVANEKGFVTYIQMFPGDDGCIAQITFTPTDDMHDPLYRAITRRMTNRKRYERRSLELTDRAVLEECAKEWKGIELRLVEGEAVNVLARALGTYERIVLENESIHGNFYGTIRWTEDEEKAKPGLRIESLEHPRIIRYLLQYVLNRFIVPKILNYARFSRYFPRFLFSAYHASSAMGALVIGGDSNDDYIAAGRAFQRLWLTVTNHGMALQPLATVPYLAMRVIDKKADLLSQMHQDMIAHAQEKIVHAFNLHSGERVAILFRLGYDGEPTLRSAKMPPNYM